MTVRSQWLLRECGGGQERQQRCRAELGAHVRLTNAIVTSSWNGEATGTGTHYSVAPPSWGATIQPGQTVTTFGFCA